MESEETTASAVQQHRINLLRAYSHHAAHG